MAEIGIIYQGGPYGILWNMAEIEQIIVLNLCLKCGEMWWNRDYFPGGGVLNIMEYGPNRANNCAKSVAEICVWNDVKCGEIWIIIHVCGMESVLKLSK